MSLFTNTIISMKSVGICKLGLGNYNFSHRGYIIVGFCLSVYLQEYENSYVYTSNVHNMGLNLTYTYGFKMFVLTKVINKIFYMTIKSNIKGPRSCSGSNTFVFHL